MANNPLYPGTLPKRDVNSIMPNVVDRTPWAYYDTLKFAPGATVVGSYILFAQAVGQPDQYNGNQVKTFVETNMLSGGSFNPPYDLLLQRICVKTNVDADLYDIQNIFKNVYMELFIQQKVFFRGHLDWYPSGTGITGVSTATTVGTYSNGTANPYATRSMGQFSRYIAPLMNFGVRIIFPETIGQATNTAAGATTNLSANQVINSQTAAALPILKTQANGGAGLWITVYLDGQTDNPVQ